MAFVKYMPDQRAIRDYLKQAIKGDGDKVLNTRKNPPLPQHPNASIAYTTPSETAIKGALHTLIASPTKRRQPGNIKKTTRKKKGTPKKKTTPRKKPETVQVKPSWLSENAVNTSSPA